MNRAPTGRARTWGWPALAVVAAGIAAAAAFGAGTGEVDPGGLTLGLAGLLLAVAGLRHSTASQHWSDTDAPALADRLARVLMTREQATHSRLLGDSVRTIDVRFAHVPTPAHHATGAGSSGSLTAVADYYRALRPGRLVVTGAPGAGKTVLALHLMLLLLDDRAPGGPVPVRLSLSTFDPHRQRLDDWIADRLTRGRLLTAAQAHALVEARLVLPVLDGLDEMDAGETPGCGSRAAAALVAVNGYLHGTVRGGLVLTCRSAAHAALERAGLWAEDAARIDILPVGLSATGEFVAGRSDDRARWEPVLRALRADPAGPLARSLSTPWRLTLAVAVYNERDPDRGWVRDPADLLGPALRATEQIRDHLLELFVRAAATKGGAAAPYTETQVRTWLTVLARYLHANTAGAREVAGRRLSGTDLVLHELWPLTGDRRARTVQVLLTVAVWAVADLPAGLLDDWWVYATNVTLLSLGSLLVALPPWPVPSRLERVSARTRAGRHQLVNGLVGGLFWGGLVVTADLGDVAGPLAGLGYGAVVGLVGGAVVGAGLAGVLSDAPDTRRSPGNASPRVVVRDDLVTGFATGLVVGLAFVPFYWFALGPLLALGAVLVYMVLFGLGGGRALALLYHRWFRCGFRGAADSLLRPRRAYGPLLRTGAGPALGAAGVRYVALLLCTRRWSGTWLPWRLGRFLDWCGEAGLTRTAGIAYQFRHRELQDFLAGCHIRHELRERPTAAEPVRI